MKGPSWLSVIPGYDLIDGMSADYMHCILLGVCRLLLHLWVQSSHCQQLWYIGNQVATIDDRLCHIKPPNEIQRTPRSLAMTVKFWKGIPDHASLLTTHQEIAPQIQDGRAMFAYRIYPIHTPFHSTVRPTRIHKS